MEPCLPYTTLSSLSHYFTVKNPCLDAYYTVSCLCLGKTIINISPYRVKWNPTFPIPLSPRYLITCKSAGAGYPYTLSTKFKRCRHCLFHRPSVRDPSL